MVLIPALFLRQEASCVAAKMKKMRIFFLIVATSFLRYSASFADDVSVITNYTPSPYGSYAKVTSDQVAIGSGYRSSAIPTDSLIVSGQVGIGTASPGSYGGTQTELDVVGEIAANDLWGKNKGKWLSQVDYIISP